MWSISISVFLIASIKSMGGNGGKGNVSGLKRGVEGAGEEYFDSLILNLWPLNVQEAESQPSQINQSPY